MASVGPKYDPARKGASTFWTSMTNVLVLKPKLVSSVSSPKIMYLWSSDSHPWCAVSQARKTEPKRRENFFESVTLFHAINDETFIRTVTVRWVCRTGQLNRSRFGGNIHNRDGIFVGTKAEFLATVGRVGTVVNDTMRVMNVSITTVAPGKYWGQRIRNVDHVQTTTASIGSHSIGKAAVFINGNVVGIAKACVPDIRRKRRSCACCQQYWQVKHLHSVTTSFRNNESIVVVYFNVSPRGVRRGRRQFTKIDRTRRTCNFNKHSSIRQSHDGKFTARSSVCPPPNIVAFPCSKSGQW